MREILSVAMAIGLIKAAQGSPASHAPLITPAPVLHKRFFDSDFVGYVLFSDGDTSVLTCRSDYTYTYVSGYAGCVESLGDLGTRCDGSTKIFTGGDTLECATACMTDYYYYSLDDTAPAWNIDCNTHTTGWTVLRMSSEDLPTISGSALSDLTSIDISTVTPPAEKTTVYITPSETSTSTTSSSSSSSSAPPTPVPVAPAPVPAPKKKSTGAIIGGAVGGALVLLGAIAAGIFFCLRRKRRTQGTPEQNQPITYNPAPTGMHQSPALSSNPTMMGMHQSPPMSPGPSFSPPPAYGHEKVPNATVSHMSSPVQSPAEYKPVDAVQTPYGQQVYAHEAYAPHQQRSELGG